MSFFCRAILKTFVLLFFYAAVLAAPDAGFYLPDSIKEMKLRYRTIKNLIILPVVIDDSIEVNLILDTGCRNLVLFGKRFQKLFTLDKNRRVQFSGLGSGGPVYGYLSVQNKVSIHQVLGNQIPIVVVPNKNIMSIYSGIHGVIGYDIFMKFEVELNPAEKTITFRPAASAEAPLGYSHVPLRIVDSRPFVNSELSIDHNSNRKCDLMIDTGSALGLLLKTTDIKQFGNNDANKVLGLGFNGPISGFDIRSNKLRVESFEFTDLPTGIIQSQWHNYASIGMGVLKNYVFVLNYCKEYACFKKITA